MVYNGNAVAGIQEICILDLFRPVGINNYQQCAAVCMQHGILRAHKCSMIFRNCFQLLNQRFCRIGIFIHNDIAANVEIPGKTAYTDRRSDTVQIAEAMPHHKHSGRVLNKLTERIRHNTGLHLGAFLDFAASAAEEFIAQTVFHNSLVSAARQCQLNRHIGKLHRFREVPRIFTEAHTHGSSNTGRAFNLMDLLQDGKLVLFHGSEIAFFKKSGVKKVCDAACGFGAYALALASNGFEVSAFDISQKAADIAKEGLKRFGYGLDAKAADILKTGYEDGIFDGVCAVSVLDHMTKADAETALCELYRITRPGGLIMLAFDKPDGSDFEKEHEILPDGSVKYKNGMIFHPYGKEEIAALTAGRDTVFTGENDRGEQTVILKKGYKNG